MKQTDGADLPDVVLVPADADVADQDEDDEPEEREGDDVAYDLDAPVAQGGGA